MTKEDVRNALLNSAEYKSLLLPKEVKSLSEINNQTKKTVDDLYREILYRPADPQGLQYYALLLDSGKMTKEDVRNALLNSTERKSMNLDNEK
jgi:hypothetical protein